MNAIRLVKPFSYNIRVNIISTRVTRTVVVLELRDILIVGVQKRCLLKHKSPAERQGLLARGLRSPRRQTQCAYYCIG